MAHRPIVDQTAALEKLLDQVKGPVTDWPLTHVARKLDALGKDSYPAELVGDLCCLRWYLIQCAIEIERFFSDESFDGEQMGTMLYLLRAGHLNGLLGKTFRDVQKSIDQAIGPDDDDSVFA